MPRKFSVAKSPHRNQIIKKIKSGWSPGRISQWLEEEHSELITDKAIRRYAQRYIPPDGIIPPSLIREKLKQVDVDLDVLNDLITTTKFMEQRLDTNLRLESELGVLLPETRKELKNYFDALVKLFDIMVRIGMIKTVPEKLDISGRLDLDAKIFQDIKILNAYIVEKHPELAKEYEGYIIKRKRQH